MRCGLCNKEIAHALGLTQATVRKHLENAFLRLGVASRTAAVAQAFGPDDGTERGHV
ncbi:response regulator transcription factor [Ornithinimicrobium flavum]|uniref:response regulator transcription factor n=1 Tax=Ornithinimicrobium flavum TaxID=1288636 RepID=UPI001EE810F4|nr:LuxR C-terminal-related transcriptional regulator [Ornithinimicrobium flavum]